MSTRSPLRAVAPNEQAAKPRPKPMTVAQAAASGTRRELLVALGARVAEAVADPHIRGADLAALSRRLLEITREIEAIDLSGVEETAEDDPIPDEPFDAWDV